MHNKKLQGKPCYMCGNRNLYCTGWVCEKKDCRRNCCAHHSTRGGHYCFEHSPDPWDNERYTQGVSPVVNA